MALKVAMVAMASGGPAEVEAAGMEALVADMAAAVKGPAMVEKETWEVVETAGTATGTAVVETWEVAEAEGMEVLVADTAVAKGMAMVRDRESQDTVACDSEKLADEQGDVEQEDVEQGLEGRSAAARAPAVQVAASGAMAIWAKREGTVTVVECAKEAASLKIP